jgi:phage terminase large subunit
VNISLPHNWRPREYQLPLWKALQSGTKRAVAVWHRRAGKDLFALNWIASQAMQRTGLYWHVFPTYKQGRKVAWEGRTGEGRLFLDAFPKELIRRRRDDEMSLWLEKGSLIQVVGADDPSSLVGPNPVGVVFSEFSLTTNMQALWDLVRPILAENGGWALFIYTPRGRNHGWRLLRTAQENPSWFGQVLPADVTGAISQEAIEDERRAGMSEEMIQQEFYCSFDAPLEGAFYGDQMKWLAQNNRITRVPWEPLAKVDTAWDLGMSDSMAIWVLQQVGLEHRAIDFYSNRGKGLDHYIGALGDRWPEVVWGRHYVPHDAQVRELGTGKSRLEVARGFGMRMTLVPKLKLMDGINATRAILPKFWFDAEKCDSGDRSGVQALREYCRMRDEVNDTYRDEPRHDWTSHPADAFRTYAQGTRPAREAQRRVLAPDLSIV